VTKLEAGRRPCFYRLVQSDADEVRVEMRVGFRTVRSEMREEFRSVREEIRATRTEAREDFRLLLGILLAMFMTMILGFAAIVVQQHL
jgi:hypothetical protein